jgi:hypothetical protein
MVAVLLAPARIAPDRLKMATRSGQIHTSVQAGGMASALKRVVRPGR